MKFVAKQIKDLQAKIAQMEEVMCKMEEICEHPVMLAMLNTATPKPNSIPTASSRKGKPQINGYIAFCNEMRNAVKCELEAEGEKVRAAIVTKVLGAKWKGLSEEMKAEYKEKAKEAHEKKMNPEESSDEETTIKLKKKK